MGAPYLLVRRLETAQHIPGDREVAARYENEDTGQITKDLAVMSRSLNFILKASGSH